MHVLKCCVVLAHQRVYVLQVMASVARGYMLTGISSCFLLFEPCMTGTAGGQSILPQSEGDAKWSVRARRFPFFVERSARGEFWWTVSTTPDKANGPNRKSLTDLDVEKLRGEDTPLGPEVWLRWVMILEDFEIASFFIENHWCRSVTLFYNVTTPYETLASEEDRDFSQK